MLCIVPRQAKLLKILLQMKQKSMNHYEKTNLHKVIKLVLRCSRPPQTIKMI